ncbi:MAG: ISAs1 family transposase [Cyanobacteria bacterium J06635_10]
MPNTSMGDKHFYLTSLGCDTCKLGQAIPMYWSVENGLHWTLDVTFNEDACRVRTSHAPQNLSLLGRIAINALNLEQSLKRSNRQKSNRAVIAEGKGWEDMENYGLSKYQWLEQFLALPYGIPGTLANQHCRVRPSKGSRGRK